MRNLSYIPIFFLLAFPFIDSGYFSISFVWLALLISLTVIAEATRKREIRYSGFLLILWVGFLILGVAVTLQALSIPWSFLGLLYVATAFLASVWGVMVDGHKTRHVVMTGIVIFSVVISLLTIADFLGVIPKEVFPSFALFRIVAGHALSGNYLLFALPILLVWGSNKGLKKLMFIVATFLIVAAFLLSFARSAFIGALAELIFLGFVAPPEIKRIARIGVLGILFWLLLLSQPAIVASIFPDFSISRFFKSEQVQAKLLYKPITRQEARLEYWRIAGVGIRERPLFGWGFGAYRFLQTRLRNTVEVYSDSAHNLYLETAIETGLVGGILFAVLTLTAISVSYRSWLFSKDFKILAFFTGLVGFAVSELFTYESIFPSIFILFWFIFGLTTVPAGKVLTRQISFPVATISVVLIIWGVFVIGGMFWARITPTRLSYLHPRIADTVLTTIVTRPFAEMEPALRKLNPVFRADRNAQLMLSSWEERQGRKAEAIAASDAAYRADPLNLVAVRWLRELLVQNGEVERAHALEDDVLARLRTDTGDAFGLKDQGNRSILLELAREDCNTGDCRRGREIYRVLLARYPDARAEVIDAILQFFSGLDKNRKQEMAAKIFDDLPPSLPQK